MTTNISFITAYTSANEHRQRAVRMTYALATAFALQGQTVTYTALAVALRVGGYGFGSRRSAATLMDGLAGLCELMQVPNLAAVFEPQDGGLTSRKWNKAERDRERQECFDFADWPPTIV